MSAPSHPLPQTQFYSIEYPGYIRPTSIPYAIRTLGGLSSVESAFKRSANKAANVLELNLRPGNPFAHPIPGDVVSTNNILIKIIKRKRQKLSDDDEQVVEYTVEALGVIPKTARFRSEFFVHRLTQTIEASDARHD
jgi:general transcription factor 3C polypeptide 5 (transcription factor C subunit 1)